MKEKLPSESLLCLLDMMLLSGDESPLTSSFLFTSDFGFSISLTFSGSFLKDPVSTVTFLPFALSAPLSDEPGLLPASDTGAAAFGGRTTGGLHLN